MNSCELARRITVLNLAIEALKEQKRKLRKKFEYEDSDKLRKKINSYNKVCI